MADGTDDVARALWRLTYAIIDAASRVAVLLAERRAQRLREAAIQSEAMARAERAKAAAHHAADTAVWRHTAKPGWWSRATPEGMARVWRAVSTWHRVDVEAASVREALAERLRQRGIDVADDPQSNPGDARWLRTALQLARLEREEPAALVAEADTDGPPIAPSSNVDFSRMEALVRRAWPGEKADAVLADGAWPLLAKRMLHLEQKGNDVPGLLQKILPINTADAKLPAVLTEWALRHAAAGPTALRKAEAVRARHHERVAESDSQTARRLRAAFPVSTRQALSRAGGSIPSQGLPAVSRREPMRDRAMSATEVQH